MNLPNRGEHKRHTGGPNRTPGKPSLIHGCEGRRCQQCSAFIIVPEVSDWTTCTPCRKGWTRG